jgi:hypothetical protein
LNFERPSFRCQVRDSAELTGGVDSEKAAEASLLEHFLPFLQEPKFIFAALAETIFIPDRMGNQLGHMPGGMQPGNVNEIAALFI